MHYRRNNVKREHSTIKGIIPILEKIAELDYVKSIVPGRIKPISGSYPKCVLEYKTKTDTGIKCLAKSERATQEVFIVTSNTEELIKFIMNLA
ncbi:MAG: DUF2103 domain-containing protein [bacterium]